MNRIFKIIGLLILAVSWQSTAKVQAQTVWTLPASGTAGTGSTAVDFEFRTDGSIVEKGSGNSSLSNADLEASARLLWIPSLNALRIGSGLPTETVSGVGQYSIALGYQNQASGYYSTVFGLTTRLYSSMGDSRCV